MRNQAIVDGVCRKLFVNPMTFGEWLRERLKQSRMSNAELARLAKVSPTYIGNLVRDYSPNTKSGKAPRPNIDLVERIAVSLNADIDDAREAAGYKRRKSKDKPTNFKEFLDCLEDLGIEQFNNFGDVRPDLPPEEYQILLEQIRMVIYLAAHHGRLPRLRTDIVIEQEDTDRRRNQM